MKDVLGILEHLGYGEIRPENVGDWCPIEAGGEAGNGRFGTTDETSIISQKGEPTCRLVDRETGQLVATARKSCPLEQLQ